MDEQLIALVSGGNRGIGLEVCKQLLALSYIVILGSRDLKKGEKAAANLKAGKENLSVQQLDIDDIKSIERLRNHVERTLGRLDVLVNNAAAVYDDWEGVIDADLEDVRKAFNTNTLGAWRMCKAFLPLLRKSKHPRIVNVSSEAGSLASMGAWTPAYNISKVALNALTRMLAKEFKRERILVNSVCPGWVATDMGGPGGRHVSKGGKSVVWAVTLPDNGPTGGFFRDGKLLPW
jgi:NAD(P)-dependent dehydrogenase (short-subunit alcohol dehydrogenase family)